LRSISLAGVPTSSSYSRIAVAGCSARRPEGGSR
jgi:hypothetical protein